MPKKTPKLVLWDLDSTLKPRPDVDVEGNELHPYDVVIYNKEFFQLTLDILHANGIDSVLAPSRLFQWGYADPQDKYKKTLYSLLDNAFGQKRGYLKKNVSESALASHSPSTIQSLANAYNPGGTSKAEDIFFINADKANKDKINKQSHFIHLSSESIQNKSYLFEILLRTTPVFDIYKSIDKSKTSKQVKNEFKKQLLDYQLNHLKQVTDWQKELLDKGDMLKNTSKKQEKPIEDYKEYTEIVTNEPDWGTIQKEKISELERKTAAYRQVLQGIQYLIFDTKWNIGILGGVNIVDETTGQKNTVPKGMNAILQEINKAQTGETTWIEALDKVKQLSIVSATKKNHGFFNKRGETTQQFYDKVQQIIKDEEKKDFKI